MELFPLIYTSSLWTFFILAEVLGSYFELLLSVLPLKRDGWLLLLCGKCSTRKPVCRWRWTLYIRNFSYELYPPLDLLEWRPNTQSVLGNRGEKKTGVGTENLRFSTVAMCIFYAGSSENITIHSCWSGKSWWVTSTDPPAGISQKMFYVLGLQKGSLHEWSKYHQGVLAEGLIHSRGFYDNSIVLCKCVYSNAD